MKTECVLVVEDGEDVSIVPYPDQHREPYKFLYFKTEDREILIVGTRMTSRHQYLLSAYESQVKERLPREALIGAGAVEPDIGIVGWHSSDFEVRTNEEAQPRIAKLLGYVSVE